MITAPIALFVYNRPDYTRATVEALQANEFASASDVFIFSDAAKEARSAPLVAKVRSYLRSIEGFRSITIMEREQNAGLARSIVDGVTRIVREHGRVIVLEDDLVTSPRFLAFMNEALQAYQHDRQVASVHGYCYPVKLELPETFFLRGADCWGWATWDRAWQHFEPDGEKLLRDLKARKLERQFDMNGAYPFTQMLRDQVKGRNSSWAVRWHAACFLKNMLTLYPAKSLVRNIGNDGSGTHSLKSAAYDVTAALSVPPVERILPAESEVAHRAIADFLRAAHGGLFRTMRSRFRSEMRALFSVSR